MSALESLQKFTLKWQKICLDSKKNLSEYLFTNLVRGDRERTGKPRNFNRGEEEEQSVVERCGLKKRPDYDDID